MYEVVCETIVWTKFRGTPEEGTPFFGEDIPLPPQNDPLKVKSFGLFNIKS